jgi:hypothetical protein
MLDTSVRWKSEEMNEAQGWEEGKMRKREEA